MDRDELLRAAEAFRADDPDPSTQAELAALLADAREGRGVEALRERFETKLSFGTAGLRGLIGAGTSRMNRRMVALTTAALCEYLQRNLPDARARGLCIGFDGRHRSADFAREVAEIACGAGFVVYAFDAVAPTPLLAFCVRERGAAAGVMITASHNPAAYNGYKLYLWDGAQLGSPHDAAIRDTRDALPSALALARTTRAEAAAAGLLRNLDGSEQRYLDAIAASLRCGASAEAAPLDLRVVYTALHGVGEPLARRALARAGVVDLQSVAAQAEPDPDFPSVAFPNPEEPGALDLALELGERWKAALVIANDPDADRLALASRDARGRLVALSGNEIGLLLADYLLASAPQDGRNLIVTTIVSTPLIERVAADHGAHCARTLTGFKWIIERAGQLERDRGLRLVLGFEEALGYCVAGIVRDKDGIAAAAHAARMAAEHAQRGVSLHGALAALYRKHGLCESQQLSIVRTGSAGLAEIRAGMLRLRSQPPEALAGLRVRHWTDLERGISVRDGVERATELPQSDVLAFELDGGQRLTIRPSGTEPKLKLYADSWTELRDGEDLASARLRARALGRSLIDALCAHAGLSGGTSVSPPT